MKGNKEEDQIPFKERLAAFLDGRGGGPVAGRWVDTPIEGSNAMGRTWVRTPAMAEAPQVRPQAAPTRVSTRSTPSGGRDPRDAPPTHSYERMPGIPGAAPVIGGMPPMLDTPTMPPMVSDPPSVSMGMQTDPTVVQMGAAPQVGHMGDQPFYESDTQVKPWWERMLGG